MKTLFKIKTLTILFLILFTVTLNVSAQEQDVAKTVIEDNLKTSLNFHCNNIKYDFAPKDCPKKGVSTTKKGDGKFTQPEDSNKESTSTTANVDAINGSYMESVVDAGPENGTSCGSCGGFDVKSVCKQISMVRSYNSRRADRAWDMGLSQSSSFDIRLTMYEEAGALVIYLEEPDVGFSSHFFDGLNSDTRDGVFNSRTASEIQLLDATETLVLEYEDAVTARLIDHDFNTYEFDVIALGGGDYAGRLTSIKNLNDYGIDIDYKIWTATEIANDAALQWQKDTVTDATGRVITFEYDAPATIAGQHVISRITMPNGEHTDYEYTGNYLSKVTYPDTSFSTHTYSVNGLGDTVLLKEATDGAVVEVRMTSNSAVIFSNTGHVMINQNSMGTGSVITKHDLADNEVVFAYMNSNHNEALVYQGEGVLKHRTIYKKVVYKTDFDATALDSNGQLTFQSVNPTTTSEPDLHSRDNDLATKVTTKEGEYIELKYNSAKDVVKIKYSDGAKEYFNYSALNKLTHYCDRLDQVTLFTYDNRGNELSKEVGLRRQGTWTNWNYTTTSEYAISTKEYYPALHANEFLLRYSTDFNGNTTEFIYNTNQLLIEVKEPDDNGGGYHTAGTMTYDSSGRLETSTDAIGRTTTLSYDKREREIKAVFEDDSSTLTIYGTGTQSDLVVKRKDRDGYTTKFEYDDAGRVSTVTRAYSTMNVDGTTETENSASVQSVTTNTYMHGQRRRRTSTTDGNLTKYIYDYRARLVGTEVYPNTSDDPLTTSSEYLLNNHFSSTDAYGRTTYNSYRASDSALIRTVVGTTSTFTLADYAAVNALTRDLSNNAAYLITDYTLDAEGQTEAVIDARGITHTNDYDSRGRVTSSTTASGTTVAATTTSEFDDQGNLTLSTNARGYSTKTEYTDRNLTESVTVAYGTAEAATMSFTYFDDGKAKETTDFIGNASGENPLDHQTKSIWHQCCGRIQAQIDQLGHGQIINNSYADDKTHIITVEDVLSHSADYHNPIDTKTINEVTTRYDARHRPIASTTWLVKLGSVDANNVPIATDPTQGLTTYTEYFDEAVDTAGTVVDTRLADLYSKANVTLGADSQGSAVIVINPEGEISASISDSLGRTIVSGIIDSEDDAITWSTRVYDGYADDLLISESRDAYGNANKSFSDGAGRTQKTVDALLNVSTHFYDANGNVVKSLDANGVGLFLCMFDERNRDYSCEDTQGDTITKTFDDNNNVLTVTDAKLENSVMTYDARDRVEKVVDRIGAQTKYRYDDNNNLIQIEDDESISNTNNKFTLYEYTNRNELEYTSYPGHPYTGTPYSTDLEIDKTLALTDANYDMVECEYDAAGRKEVCTDQLGDTVTYVYDMANHLKTRKYRLFGEVTDELPDNFTYDYASRLLTAIKGRYSNTITNTYDDAGRLFTETLTVNGEDYTTKHEYDDASREIKCTYPDDLILDKEWTKRNQVEWQKFDTVPVVTNYYDAGFRQTSKTLGDNLGNDLVTNYAFGRSDNLVTGITVVGEDDLSFTYDYDDNKNLIREGRLGVLSGTSFDVERADGTDGYDAIDRIIGWKRDNTIDKQEWTLTSVGDWDDTTVNGVYQDRDHNDVHELTDNNGVSVTYDAKGNQTSGGKTWDIDNHLQSSETPVTSGLIGHYKMDETSGSTVIDSSAEGNDGSLENGTLNNQTGVFGKAYSLDGTNDYVDISDLTADIDSDEGSVSIWVNPEDATQTIRHHILRIEFGTSDDCIVLSYVPDSEIVRINYESDNNSKKSGVFTIPDNTWTNLTVTWSTTADELKIYKNGVQQVTTKSGLTPIVLAPTSIELGRNLNDSNRYFKGMIDEAQFFNRVLTDAEIAALSNTASYTYDALGRRVSKTVGGTETIFVSSGQQVLCEYDSAAATTAPSKTYVYGNYIDEPLMMIDGSGDKYYYHQNRQFNVIGMTDELGDVVELMAYNTYGEVEYFDDLGNSIAGTTVGNPYEFTGRRKDAETGLYYFRARYFDAEQGRFISRDPIGYVDGFSLYAGYFGSRFDMDPTGLKKIVVNSKKTAEELLEKIKNAAKENGGAYALSNFEWYMAGSGDDLVVDKYDFDGHMDWSKYEAKADKKTIKDLKNKKNWDCGKNYFSPEQGDKVDGKNNAQWKVTDDLTHTFRAPGQLDLLKIKTKVLKGEELTEKEKRKVKEYELLYAHRAIDWEGGGRGMIEVCCINNKKISWEAEYKMQYRWKDKYGWDKAGNIGINVPGVGKVTHGMMKKVEKYTGAKGMMIYSKWKVGDTIKKKGKY